MSERIEGDSAAQHDVESRSPVATTGARMRNTGIDVIGAAPWGTHFCQFYQTTGDLLDILVPYFKAGLEANEFCMWVTSDPLPAREAEKALRRAMPGLDRYLDAGQLEILPYSDWYTKGGGFDSQRVLDGWLEKLDGARARGFDGLRLTGNTFWLEKADWNDFTDYEAAVNDVIGKYPMMAICTYCLDRCSAHEVIDVIKNHQFALIKREGRWESIQSEEQKRAQAALRESEAMLAAELAATKQLQAISSQLILEDNLDALHEEILDAAIVLMHADAGSLQMLDPEMNELQLLAWKGFDRAAAAFWRRVRVRSRSACGIALQRGERVIVPDVEACDLMRGTRDLIAYRRSCIRAVQTTPLVSRSGRLVGMISTHWNEVHEPSSRELGLLDVLARQAADLIERKRSEEERTRLLRDLDRQNEELGVQNEELQAVSVELESKAVEIAERNAALQSALDRVTSANLALQASEARFEAIFEQSGVGLVELGPSGGVLRVNSEMCKILGCTEDELLGRRFDILIRPDDLEEEQTDLPVSRRPSLPRAETPEGRPIPFEDSPAVRALKGETVQGMPMVVHTADGRTVWLSVSAAPLVTSAGTLIGAVSTFVDISSLHELQEEREDLTRTVSHDLRNPLTSIMGQAQLLQRILGKTGVDGRVMRSLEAIVTGSRRMDSMVQDLVDLSRLESKQLKLDRRPLGLAASLRDLLDRSRGVLEVGRVRVDMADDLPLVDADLSRLERIFSNLISNALKYSDSGTEIVVRAEAVDGVVNLSVVDHGTGISPDELPHVFDRFYRSRNAKKAEGLGLGLYITKMLVEAHGGAIRAESEVGLGSTFILTLPVHGG